MAYIALYRKYRSQNFGELMGQEATTKTLQNALRSGKLAHAYLFTGARGCGKTSTARLLAKALNCVGPDGTRTTPNPEPCDVCRLCVAIREGRCLDVIEIDAASETSIDNVREKIIENVQYAPAEGRYKVYIIDEVHDLSSKAFDALLKTLEEPPDHVVFVLATTELQKVPITIQSRCQKYQFKRGSLQDLGKAISRVIAGEGYTAEPEAVESVARSAEGSWRDALSLLEQVLAYSDGHITSETVQQAIGTVGSETLAQVTETIASGDWSATLGLAAELVDSGKDVRQLMTAFAGHLRDLMLISAGARNAAAQEMGAEKLAVLLPQAQQFAPQTLLAMMGVLSAEERELRFTNQHRYLLERTLLKLLMVAQGHSVGTPESGSGPTGAQAVVAPRPTPTRPAIRPAAAASSYTDDHGAYGQVVSQPTPQPVIQNPEPPRPALVAHHTPDANFAPETEDVPDDTPPTPLKMVDTSAPTLETVAPSFPTVLPSNLPPVTPDIPAVASFSATATPTAAPPSNGNGASAPPPDNSHRFADGVSLEVVQRAWPRILKLFKQKSPSGIGFLEKAEVVGLDGNVITLAFSDSFSRDRIQNKGKELVEKKINEGLNTDGYKIRCILQSDMEGGSGVPISGPLPTTPSNGQAVQMATLLDAPVVQAPVQPSGIGAFGIEAPTPTTTPAYATYGNGHVEHSANDSGFSEIPHYANGSAPAPVPPAPPIPDPVSPPAPSASNGLLKEVLDLFGGQVVRTE